MVTVTFEIKTELAERWTRILRHEFTKNLGSSDKANKLDLNQLAKLALYSFIADIASRDASEALRNYEESLEIE